MTEQRCREIQSAFDAALETSPEQRSEYVKGRCGGDPELLHAVMSLLGSYNHLGDFLNDGALKLLVVPAAPRLESAVSIGTLLGPYRIERLVGSGGMGQVYQATDTRLDRTVAVKMIRSPFMPSPGRRFRLEMQTISELSHPHICTLFDVGAHGEIDYFVMEFLEGETLGERLKTGPLSMAEALRCAHQIAAALDMLTHGVLCIAT